MSCFCFLRTCSYSIIHQRHLVQISSTQSRHISTYSPSLQNLGHFSMRRAPQSIFIKRQPEFSTDDPLLKDWEGSKVPIIRVPKKLAMQMGKALDKKLAKDAALRQEKIDNMGRPLLIAAKRPLRNFRLNQPSNKFQPTKLASSSWKNNKSRGDYFCIKAIFDNPSFKRSGEGDTFANFDLHPHLLDNIDELHFQTCTNVQKSAIPTIMSGENVIAAAETGSGKTLAYLIPMFDKLLKSGQSKDISINQPRGLVLVPSRELAHQIYHVASALNSDKILNIDVLIGGERTQLKLNHPKTRHVDILIATPGVLTKLLTNRIVKLDQLQMIVVDEADSLFDDSFSERVKSILFSAVVQGSVQAEGILRANPDLEQVGAQLVLMGATLPQGLDNILEGVVATDKFVRVTTAHLHRMMPHVKQMFVRTGPAKKAEMVLQLCRQDMKKGVATMIFCHDSPTCDWLSRFLIESECPNLSLNGRMGQRFRRGRFEQFKNGEVPILVCTDIASRGLDTTFVEHVINYDFPMFVSDYIHRCGRVGRIGSSASSHVTSYVARPFEVEVLQKIEEAARKTKEIASVNANISRKINEKYGLEYGDLNVGKQGDML